jgi:hypothetical protein
MKRIYLTIATLIIFFSAHNARADLMTNVCDMQGENQTLALAYAQTWADTSIGLSCDQVKTVAETYKVVRISIEPLILVAAAPAVKQAFAQSARAFMKNPETAAVLSLVLLGAYGINTVKILMNEAIDDCARRDQLIFKQQILEEVYRKYGTRPDANTPFEVHAP